MAWSSCRRRSKQKSCKIAFSKVDGEHHSMRELRNGKLLRDVYAQVWSPL